MSRGKDGERQREDEKKERCRTSKKEGRMRKKGRQRGGKKIKRKTERNMKSAERRGINERLRMIRNTELGREKEEWKR